MDTIKILLADDHVLVRQGTRELLEREADLEVVAEAGDGEEAVELTHIHHPDLVIMDISMPKLDGIEATRKIKAQHPGISVLVLTAYDDDPYIFALLEAGAAGYLLKDVPAGALVKAVREVHAREKRLRQEAIARLERLNRVAEEITSELELDHILPKVLQIAKEMVEADGGAIALLDREKNRISYPYLDHVPHQLSQVTIPLEHGLAGQVMTTSRPTLIQDYAAYSHAIPEFVAAGVTSAIAVPIASGDRSFGTLILFGIERAAPFSERHVTALVAIGRQTGIAIENARLYENLRFYVQQITQAQEDERKRIARELHDDTIQMLIVISRRLEALATQPDPLPASAAQAVASLQALVGDTLKSIRRFVQDLRPPSLDHLGLVATIERLTREMEEQDGIETKLLVVGEKRRLLAEQELLLFRTVQEGLSNIRRHANASRATVKVEFLPHLVRITIQDDGRGFNTPERVSDLVPSGKLGLTGMQERVKLLGGTLRIQSELDQGTIILVDVPA